MSPWPHIVGLIPDITERHQNTQLQKRDCFPPATIMGMWLEGRKSKPRSIDLPTSHSRFDAVAVAAGGRVACLGLYFPLPPGNPAFPCSETFVSPGGASSRVLTGTDSQLADQVIPEQVNPSGTKNWLFLSLVGA